MLDVVIAICIPVVPGAAIAHYHFDLPFVIIWINRNFQFVFGRELSMSIVAYCKGAPVDKISNACVLELVFSPRIRAAKVSC